MSGDKLDVMAFGYKVPEDILSEPPKIGIFSLGIVTAYLRAEKGKSDPFPFERASQQAMPQGGAAVTEALPDLDTRLDPAPVKSKKPRIASEQRTISSSLPRLYAKAFAQVHESLTAIGYVREDNPAAQFYEIRRNRPGERYEELAAYSIPLKKGGHHHISILKQTSRGVSDYVAVGYKAGMDDIRYPEKGPRIRRVASIALASLAFGIQSRETPFKTSGDVMGVFSRQKNFYTERQDGRLVPQKISPRRSDMEQKPDLQARPPLTPAG